MSRNFGIVVEDRDVVLTDKHLDGGLHKPMRNAVANRVYVDEAIVCNPTSDPALANRQHDRRRRTLVALEALAGALVRRPVDALIRVDDPARELRFQRRPRARRRPTSSGSTIGTVSVARVGLDDACHALRQARGKLQRWALRR
jgi:hypothetical protein